MKRTVKFGLSGSGKKQKNSYMNRYKQRKQSDQQREVDSMVGIKKGWNVSEIIERRDKIIDKVHRQVEVSKMRIEDQSQESQFQKDDYMDLELNLSKRINEIEQQTIKIKAFNNREMALIKHLEQDLQSKNNKVKQLQVKIDEATHRSQVPVAEEQEEANQAHYKQLLKILQESDKQIKLLKLDRQQLIVENAKLQQSIAKLKGSISESQIDDQSEQSSTSDYNPRMQSLVNDIDKIQMENKEIEELLNVKEDNLEVEEEDQAINFDLAEKVFIISQLEKLDQLMTVKENEFKKVEEFQRNKHFLKLKQKDIDLLEKEIKKKKTTIGQLTEQIKQKSADLLLCSQF